MLYANNNIYIYIYIYSFFNIIFIFLLIQPSYLANKNICCGYSLEVCEVFLMSTHTIYVHGDVCKYQYFFVKNAPYM